MNFGSQNRNCDDNFMRYVNWEETQEINAKCCGKNNNDIACSTDCNIKKKVDPEKTLIFDQFVYNPAQGSYAWGRDLVRGDLPIVVGTTGSSNGALDYLYSPTTINIVSEKNYSIIRRS